LEISKRIARSLKYADISFESKNKNQFYILEEVSISDLMSIIGEEMSFVNIAPEDNKILVTISPI
jgi:hypothetical protein